MPEIIKEIIVRAPLTNTWALVSDMNRFSLCIPGCKKVSQVSDNEFDWDLETKVLRTTRQAKARTKAVVMQAPTHSEFVGEGRLFERSNHYKLTIKGTTDLETISDGITRIRFAGDVRASGVGGAIIEKVAAGQMDDLFKEFEGNIKNALGDTGGPVTADELPVRASEASSGMRKEKPGYTLVLAGAGALLAVVVIVYLFS